MKYKIKYHIFYNIKTYISKIKEILLYDLKQDNYNM